MKASSSSSRSSSGYCTAAVAFQLKSHEVKMHFCFANPLHLGNIWWHIFTFFIVWQICDYFQFNFYWLRPTFPHSLQVQMNLLWIYQKYIVDWWNKIVRGLHVLHVVQAVGGTVCYCYTCNLSQLSVAFLINVQERTCLVLFVFLSIWYYSHLFRLLLVYVSFFLQFCFTVYLISLVF